MILRWLVPVLTLAATATAQTERPYFYLWAAPEEGWSTMTGHASQMVRVFVVHDPAWSIVQNAQAKAHEAVTEVNIQLTSGLTEAGHICILPQNFGDWIWAGQGIYLPHSDILSFLNPADAVNPIWLDPLNPHPEWRLDRCRQPWMTQGRADLKLWMETFVARYDQLGGPKPDRFHFDTEVGLNQVWHVNHTRVLEAVANDPRWDDPLYPVGNTGKTMAELFEEARIAYGWPANASLDDLVDGNVRPDDVVNRPYYLWYIDVCKQAVDAAMKEAAYDVIQNFVGANSGSWADVKVSNYGHAAADGVVDSFGWYPGGPPDANGVRGPEYLATRGEMEQTWAGERNEWFSQNGIDRLWLTQTGAASGDFSSPVLYPIGFWHRTDNHRDFYLPGWPAVTDADASMYASRRWVESVLNSSFGAPEKLAPWIPVPNSVFSWTEDNITYSHTVNQTEFRQLLAMLRAKGTEEILVWWNSGAQPTNEPPPYLSFSNLIPILDQVYRPHLYAYNVVSASEVYPTTHDPDRLRYTFAEVSGTWEETPTLQTITHRSEPIGDQSEVVEIRTTFHNMQDPALGNSVVFNLECAVDDTNGLRGHIYVLEQDGDWIEQDYVADEHIAGFKFYAPASEIWCADFNPGVPAFISKHATMFQTRRSGLIGRHDLGGGVMEVKIVLSRNAALGPFEAVFDLVQIVGAPDIAGGGGCTCQDQGADYDYSQTVGSSDFSAFMTDFTAGHPRADFNNDGQVNTLDAAVFTQLYQNR